MQLNRDSISYQIGQRIYTYRKQKKLSQEELAFASDIHPAYLGRVERGEKCPTIQTLYKVSLGLKVPLSELVDISAEIKPTTTQAIQRIENAISDISEEQAVEIAEIVEKIIKFQHS